ncbi:hypothetical protein FVA81_07035 [Rhizobium sp. WL3]|uniref:hypothetical protein n=1 Tax=Rhizobium sp. WL3 TaxID=2603277 RepID=UPI0011C200F1|nr:hypothetical protein [Rhizobium sp. WL3]QEE44377.1 hypothetical protein FVA81_07035 [Rhizobium sp. WL3]
MQTTLDTYDPVPADDIRTAPTATPMADDASRAEIRRFYPASAFRGPLFETNDKIALAMATVMLIGPLVALPIGLG